MKKTSNKILSLLIVLSMLFAISSVPASAVNIYEENNYKGLKEVYDFGNKEDKNFFEKISDTFHWYIARLFVLFEAECPICGEHFVVPSLENDVVVYYNQAINALKDYKGTVYMTKKTTTDVQLSEPVPQAIKNILISVADGISGTSKTSYTFFNGTNLNGVKITYAVQPLGREACLTAEGVNSSFARMSDNEGGIESITISLVEESSVYDGTVVQNPIHNMCIIEPLNPAILDLAPVYITNAMINYPETVAGITFDKKGRVDSIDIRVPMEIDFTCRISSLIMATTACEAEIIEEYDFTYLS